ncbi:MAG TPA: ATP-binding protein [Ignavibacteria bacterium]
MSQSSENEELTYIISHDLQEPIRMINSYVKLLEKKYGSALDEEAKTYITYALDGANKLKIMVDDLVNYSRLRKEKTRKISFKVSDAIERAVKMVSKRYLDHDYEIEYNVTVFPEIVADKIQVIQLFLNIIDNSIKFNLESQKKVSIITEKSGDYFKFCVSDNGIGIDRQYHDKIFRIFQKLHSQSEFPGSGIGLAICKKVVENHNGKIWIESESGKGTKIFFTFPFLI